MKSLAYSPQRKSSLYDETRVITEDMNNLLASLKHREEDLVHLIYSIDGISQTQIHSNRQALQAQITEFEYHRRLIEDQILRKYSINPVTVDSFKK